MWKWNLPPGPCTYQKGHWGLQRPYRKSSCWTGTGATGSGKLGASGAAPRGPVFTKPRSTYTKTMLDIDQIMVSSPPPPERKPGSLLQGSELPDSQIKQCSYGHQEEVGDAEQAEWVRYSYIHSFTPKFFICQMGKGNIFAVYLGYI